MSSHIGAPSNRRNYHAIKGSIKTDPENFAKDVLELMESYTDSVIEGIAEETKETAETGRDLLRMATQTTASSPRSAKPLSRRQWKKYSKSWSVDGKEGRTFYHATIRNRKHYRLTHLLEYGHATRDGKRTRAFSHIKPVEELCIERMMKNIPKIIEKGGK